MLVREAIYLAFTDIASDELARALMYFQKIILYRLPDDQIEGLLAEAAGQGLVEVVEINAFEDTAELKSILSGFRVWSEQFQGTGLLPLVRNVWPASQANDTSSRLASTIRGYDRTGKPDQDVLKEAQVLLHFARQFDSQQREIDEMLADVDRREGLLGDVMGVEEAADRLGDSASETKPAGRDAMTPELLASRLTAWSRFYARQASAATPLFTHQNEIIGLLDQTMAGNRPGRDLGKGEATEVLEPFLEICLPVSDDSASLNDIVSRRQERSEKLGPSFSAAMEKILSKTWPRGEISNLKQDFDRMIQEAGISPELKAGQSYAYVKGFLMPGTDIRQAYLEAAGLAPAQNAAQDFCGPIFEIGTARL